MNSAETTFQVHCETGNISVMKHMVTSGIDVNWSDEDGATVLQTASANGRDDIVEYLLCHDTIIDKPNCLGWTPLMHATRNRHPSTVDVLLSYGANIQLRNGMVTT
jgi:ankyrin repeat protein